MMRPFAWIIIAAAMVFAKAEATYTWSGKDNCDCFTEVVADLGYRVDNLKWSIQGANGTPNILSELTFREIKIVELGLKATVLWNDIYFRGDFDYGWILKGETQDSDFHGNNRTDEFSRSILATNDDHVLDVSGGIGFLYNVCDTGLYVVPIAGLSYHQQNFRLSNGEQLIDTTGTIGIGPISGLNSTYRAHWYSPWLGVDVGYANSCVMDLVFYSSYEYHWVDFRGKGHWNLRQDILNGEFFHEANNGEGHLVKVGVGYPVCDNMIAGLSGDFKWFKSAEGVDHLHSVEEDGSVFQIVQRLNPVHWHSWAIKLDLAYQF